MTSYSEGEAYSKYKLSTEMLSNLHRLSNSLLGNLYDKNYYYLFDKSSFLTSKALNIVIPGGPKFEPLEINKLDYYES